MTILEFLDWAASAAAAFFFFAALAALILLTRTVADWLEKRFQR